MQIDKITLYRFVISVSLVNFKQNWFNIVYYTYLYPAYPSRHFTGYAKQKLLATFNVANDINNGKCRGRRRPCAPRFNVQPTVQRQVASGKWQVALATAAATRLLLIVLQTKRKRNKQPSHHPHTPSHTHTHTLAAPQCFLRVSFLPPPQKGM